MSERMLNKQVVPTIDQMREYCGENAALFTSLNEWLFSEYDTDQEIVFPYGNKYGWAIAHKKAKKLICNVFPEDNAFTVMIRLSNKQYNDVYEDVQKITQEYIDNKYPCSDGGWIHYRITCKEHLEDMERLLTVKCSKGAYAPVSEAGSGIADL